MTIEDSDSTTFPTLYAMGKIGVGGASEALEAYHFCSDQCRELFRLHTPSYSDGGWQEGRETLSVDGDLCSYCDRELT